MRAATRSSGLVTAAWVTGGRGRVAVAVCGRALTGGPNVYEEITLSGFEILLLVWFGPLVALVVAMVAIFFYEELTGNGRRESVRRAKLTLVRVDESTPNI